MCEKNWKNKNSAAIILCSHQKPNFVCLSRLIKSTTKSQQKSEKVYMEYYHNSNKNTSFLYICILYN